MTLTITLVALAIEVLGGLAFAILGYQEILKVWLRFFSIFWLVWVVAQLVILVLKGG